MNVFDYKSRDLISTKLSSQNEMKKKLNYINKNRLIKHELSTEKMYAFVWIF